MRIPTLVLICSCLCSCSRSEGAPRFVDEIHEGRLEAGDQILAQDGSYYDRYAFRARKGDRILITMKSGEVDSVLALFDSESNQVATNDDAIEVGDDRDARIEILAPKDDVYTIVANSVHAGETGAYVVHVQTSAPPGAGDTPATN